MTETLSIKQARELGFLDKPGTLDKRRAAVADAKSANGEVVRQKARWKLLQQILELGYPVRLEHRFHDSRRWRFDIAVFSSDLEPFLAIEIDGGGWNHGAHHRKKGRDNDNAKDAEAQILGWRVIRVGWEHVKNGEAIALVRRIMEG